MTIVALDIHPTRHSRRDSPSKLDDGCLHPQTNAQERHLGLPECIECIECMDGREGKPRVSCMLDTAETLQQMY